MICKTKKGTKRTHTIMHSILGHCEKGCLLDKSICVKDFFLFPPYKTFAPSLTLITIVIIIIIGGMINGYAPRTERGNFP